MPVILLKERHYSTKTSSITQATILHRSSRILWRLLTAWDPKLLRMLAWLSSWCSQSWVHVTLTPTSRMWCQHYWNARQTPTSLLHRRLRKPWLQSSIIALNPELSQACRIKLSRATSTSRKCASSTLCWLRGLPISSKISGTWKNFSPLWWDSSVRGLKRLEIRQNWRF